MTQARDQDLTVRGLRLHARLFDGPPGPTALLLHGWMDSCASFDLLAPLLAEAGPVVALDFRGHGDSEWAPLASFYHVVEYVADVDGALDALAVQGPVRLVGHSLGGAVALLYAAGRPARTLHATLLDAMPLTVPPEEVPLRLSSWLEDLRKPRQRRRVDSVDDAVNRLVRFNPSLPREAARHLAAGGVSPDATQGGGMAWKWDPLLRGHSPMPFNEPALQALAGQITAPVLLVRGGSGFVPEPALVKERMATLRSLTIETIEQAGHHLHLERPGEVAALVLREWARLSARGATESRTPANP